MNWIWPSQNRNVEGSNEDSNEMLGSSKCGEFIEYLRNVETTPKRFCLLELVD